MALITARGGSKGIPGKNIKVMAGKPLIAWSILAAQQARAVQRVVVSTDDPEIAQVSRQWGAETPFLRPAELAGDNSPHLGVLLHALDWLLEREGYQPQYLLLLQPTSPLRQAQDIDQAVDLARARQAPAVIGLCEAAHHPYLLKRLTPQGGLEDFLPVPPGYLRRQDLPQALAINGAIYLITPQALRQGGSLCPPGTLPLVTPAERSLDVDTPWDFHLADLLLRDLHGAADDQT